MKRLRDFGKLIFAALLVVALFWTGAALLGYVPGLQRSGGRALAPGRLNFDTGNPLELLANRAAGPAEINNVILLIGDGMGFSHVQAARSHLVGPNGRLAFERMPITGWLTTHSADRIYTDSASAATALASGCKTAPGRLSVRPDGTPCRTLVEAARAAGLSIGLITDSYFYDATIAAFVVHLSNRRDYQTVITLITNAQIDILMGSMRDEVPRSDREKALDGFAATGYLTAHDWMELQAHRNSAEGQVAAIFEAGAVAERESAPTLRQLLDFSLERLDKKTGFFLLIETEDPDTGSHDGNLEQAMRGIGALADVADRALDFARQNGRTLVLVTSDHETGGLSLLDGRHGDQLRYRWNTSHHTGAPVPLYAFGPGAERFSGARDNTEVAPIIASLLGVDLQSTIERNAPLTQSGAAK